MSNSDYSAGILGIQRMEVIDASQNRDPGALGAPERFRVVQPADRLVPLLSQDFEHHLPMASRSDDNSAHRLTARSSQRFAA